MRWMTTNHPMRLGFAVKILRRPELKSHDTRRWRSDPHLSVSLHYLEQILDYLHQEKISMYRISSDLAPYATHPDLPQFHGMIDKCQTELARLGRKANRYDIRLSFHPSQYIVLNSPDSDLVQRSILDLETQARLLDSMAIGRDGVLVIHVGGVYDDRKQARSRWVQTWEGLSEPVRRRLVLEHDDSRFSPADILWIHERTGVPLIFDYQHFWCLNPEGLGMHETLERVLGTWPGDVRPKIHFSSPRTDLLPGASRKEKSSLRWRSHGDLINPFEFATFIRSAADLQFDVMLETKGKDLALIQLRKDLAHFAPDVARRFNPPMPSFQDL